MRIWHVGARPSPNAVDGVGMVVWQTAREQAKLGHDVTLVLDDAPDAAAQEVADGSGIELAHLPSRLLRYRSAAVRALLKARRPDVVHMHKTFVPQQLALTRSLVGLDIPYVITPHGGVNHRRTNVKKSAYTWLVERGRFQRAAAITTVAPLEERAIRKVVPTYKGPVRWVPNPVDTDLLESYEWCGDLAGRRATFLGRFHVVNKGIDTLVEISRRLPDLSVNLYGSPHPQTERLLASITADLPPNVRLNGTVSGEQKARLLANSSLYIQTSRWEGFSISISEAMYLGVPCVVCESPHPPVQMVHHAEVMQERGFGLVLPQDPEKAARKLAEALESPEDLRASAARAKKFARENFSPKSAALAYLDVYREVLTSSR